MRFRTLGCYPLTGAVESNARRRWTIVEETLQARTSERQGRVIDHDGRGVDGVEEAAGLLLSRQADARCAHLESHQCKDRLRFVTCGSVDDGKSTLIGRLLYESQMVFDDQLAALEARSALRQAATSTSRSCSTA